MATRTFEIASWLRASPEVLWAQVSTMRGVNEELRPWVRMTFPREAEDHHLGPEDTGRVLFTSTMIAFGVVPYDRHALRLTRVVPGEGFVEESTSWTMRTWRHERTIDLEAGETRLTDRVTFDPRMPGVGAVVGRMVGAVFRHRHEVLRRRFGGRASEEPSSGR